MSAVFPLSLAQARFLALERARPGFNQAAVYTLRGPLDVEVLRRALAEIVRRHDVLRMVIETRHGEDVQVVRPDADVALPVTELRGTADAHAAARRLAREEACRAFDLAAGPLFRFRVMRVGADEHLLVAVLHHVVSDGWSTFVLFRELAALYPAFLEGRPSPLAPLPLQYGAFAERQRATLSSAAFRRRLASARERMAAIPTLHLPTDRPRPSPADLRAAVHAFDLSRPLLDAVGAIARDAGVTLHAALSAAFALLVARWSGRDDVLAAGAVGNREGETEGMIGYFLELLPLRTELAGDPSFRALLPRVHAATAKAFEEHDIPVDALLAGLPAAPGGPAPMSVLFVLHDRPWPALRADPLALEMELLEVEVSPWELVVSLRRHSGGAHVRMLYRTALWDAATMRAAGERFAALLEAVAARPDLPVSGLPFDPLPRRGSGSIETGATPIAPPAAEEIPMHPNGASASPSPQAPPVEGERIVPQSFAQQRLWFVDRMQPGNTAYNITRAWTLAGPLDADALRRALAEIVRRHEALRTVFAMVGEAPMQVVRPRIDLPLAEEDVAAADPEARREEVLRRAREEAARPFDLERGPLLRATLLRLAPREHALVLSMHHVVGDGWSVGVLLRELGALYGAFSRGEPSPLPPLPMQYAEYAAWQREWLSGERLKAQLAYWTRRLEGAPATLELPTDRPRPAVPSSRGAQHAFALPAALAGALRALAREEGASLFMALLAAFQALLARWSGQHDVVVGTPVANRARRETEPLIGFFVNTLPLRADLSGEPGLRALLRRVRDAALDAYAHQDVPFERLVDELHVERTLAHHPVFQVLFALQNAPADVLRLGGLAAEHVEAGASAARVDLTLSLTEVPGAGIDGVLEYATDLFDRGTAERLCRHFARLLEGAAADPDAPLAALPLMDGAERRTVLETWNATAADYPRDATIHALFAGAAAARPQAVALAGDFGTMTYGELDARSARLARRLRSRGVAEGTPVAMAIERSAEAVVAMLAVLRAGGAYVPLDPGYPPERLAAMAGDARCAVLLVRGDVPPALRGLAIPAVALAAGADGADDAAPLPPAATAESPACVLFTSGSTGRPKGVAVPHRAVVRLVRGTTLYPFGADDVVLHAAPLAFDASTIELWGALLNGGRVAVFRAGPPALAELGGFVRAHGVTWAWLTSGLFNAMVDERVDDLAGLRQLCAGGEALSVTHVRRALERLPGVDLRNGYGPTENATFTTGRRIRPEDLERPGIPLGEPLPNNRVYVLDARLRPVPVGIPGELCAAGDGLALGYVGDPALTAEKFVTVELGDGRTERVYRTGDRVRWLPEGALEFLGRLDAQVKVRGFRIEPGEIEAALRAHPGVREAAVVVVGDTPATRRLVAYVVPGDGSGASPSFLARALPAHLLPSAVVELPALPLTPAGKVDRRALPPPEAPRAPAAPAAPPPELELERRIAAVWAGVLGVDRVGVDENFFEQGGTSLLLIALHERMRKALPEAELALLDLFRHPTVRAQAEHLGGARPAPAPEPSPRPRGTGGGIAIVGMSGRFPGAPDVEAFWRNLRDGVESISFFSHHELREAGVPPELLADPKFVRAAGVVPDIDRFDAGFFGFTPLDATILDPQHRLWLECAWEALERAGYVPGETPNVGVYAGATMSGYYRLLLADPELEALTARFSLHIANDKDGLTPRTAYKLGLDGPTVTVQSACSTSLVAVHVACRALLGGECDVALAGGVTLRVPQKHGYLYEEGGIASPDGHCRAFDASSRGAVHGNGVGVVVLKRLDDALADGDTIHAVILGSAVNNDGARRVGFTAPSVSGQARVVRKALAAAGVAPDTVGYVEAHGTGTELGDPIEVAALTEAYGPRPPGSIGLGSVKSNVGHLDSAAGVTGLIKAALSVERGELVPTLHVQTPNPKIDWARSPFRPVTALRPWGADGTPRRAGVSAFGMGGSNAHVVLQEPPPPEPADAGREWRLLTLAARSPRALDAATERLAAHLRAHPEQAPGDVAWTLAVGRKEFAHRRAVVVRRGEDAAAQLDARAPGRAVEGRAPEERRPVAFLFSGLGDQYVGMGRGLYDGEPVFRAEVDRCAELLRPHLDGVDLRDVLYPPETAPAGGGAGGIDFRRMAGRAPAEPDAAAARLNRTELAHPAVFVVGWALARLWESWGIVPAAVMGHSLGEYTAACVAGVLPLEDALELVAARARLIQALPGGAMLAVSTSPDAVRPFLAPGAAVAAVNAPEMCTVAGPDDAVAETERRLREAGRAARRLPTTHAFHSRMMQPAAAGLADVARRMRFSAPRIPLAGNVTGTWMTEAEATDPGYWARHLCEPVRFDAGVAELARGGRVLLELGPGQTLAAFARQQPRGPGEAAPLAVSSLRHTWEETADAAYLLGALGRLWTAGVVPDWRGVFAGERRRRVPLPTYPFERSSYWIGSRGVARPAPAPAPPPPGAAPSPPAEWFHVPSWRRTLVPAAAPAARRRSWLVLDDGEGVGDLVATRLRDAGDAVTLAAAGDGLARSGEAWTLRPGEADDLHALLRALAAEGRAPDEILHLWCLPAADEPAGDAQVHAGFHALRALAAALADEGGERPVRVRVLASQAQAVESADRVVPEKALLLGALRGMGQEDPRIACRAVDFDAARPGDPGWAARADRIAAEALSAAAEPLAAWRGHHRYAQGWERVPLGGGRPVRALREGGVYLVTGGLGRVGMLLAGYLAREHRARLVLTARSPLPPPEAWEGWLAEHGDGDPAARRIRAIRRLEADGAEVMAVSADVADEAAMRGVIDRVRARWGGVDGVVHAAGVVTGSSIYHRLAALSPSDAAEQFRAKVMGTRVLERVLPDEAAFCLLLSSNTSILGGLGLGAYGAANVFLDAFAAAKHRAGDTRWISLGSDGWPREGAAVVHTSMDEFEMTPDQAIDVFRRAVCFSTVPHLSAAMGDLRARLDRWLPARPPAEISIPEPLSDSSGTPAAPGVERSPRDLLPLSRPYAAPREGTERALAELWERLLGVDGVGAHDNFFELGGHSLAGTRLIARIRQEMGVELPIQSLFRSPTVAAMAAEIDAMRLREVDPEVLERALDEVLRLAPEQALALLGGAPTLAGSAR